MKLTSYGLIIFSFTLLFGCASNPSLVTIKNLPDYQLRLAAIDDWQLRGKIILLSADDSEKAKFSWKNSHDEYKIRLSGTLGMGTTYIKGDKNSVRLEQNGKEPVTANSPEQLIYDQLGRDIPISHLNYWVRGIPSPDIKIDNAFYSNNGMLNQLEQAGWTLNFNEFSVNGEWNLPSEMTAARNDIELHLSINKWIFNPAP